jgi:hypothetical protein
VNTDIWVGAVTALIGAGLGGAISFVLNRQQSNDARLQRKEEELRERKRRSEDRRFQAYSDFLTRARSYRNAVQAYYLHADNRPPLGEVDALLLAATDASSLVFLVVESDGTYKGCITILQALWRTQTIIHHIEPSTADDPWTEINNELGRSTRNFQNAARHELGVSGPMEPWVTYNEKSHPDILATELKARDLRPPPKAGTEHLPSDL